MALAAPGFSAVTVVGTEDGPGVIETYSGTLNGNDLGPERTVVTETERSNRNNQAFAYYDGGDLSRYGSVGTTPVPVISEGSLNTGTGSGDAFAFGDNDLFVDIVVPSVSRLRGSLPRLKSLGRERSPEGNGPLRWWKSYRGPQACVD